MKSPSARSLKGDIVGGAAAAALSTAAIGGTWFGLAKIYEAAFKSPKTKRSEESDFLSEVSRHEMGRDWS